ncbi:cell wall-binding repeat-containing protein [Bacillus sp. Cs-700]|uniref:cell wall-binding repeat-containing protein n=1 Tax=Bacillus sp. Cs-700 TaxID=2589818 RepID=UPI0014076B78|nr:cell wall-binding repeat-containing protein [Bacillus sp. Cs-700]
MKSTRLDKIGLLTILVFFMLNVTTHAAPASDQTRSESQPNGLEFELKAAGDEVRHWFETAEGQVILQEDNNYWVYAMLKDEKLIRTEAKVGIDAVPESAARHDEMLKLPDTEDSKRFTERPEINQVTIQSTNQVDKHPLLVLLVNFQDKKIKYSEASWNNTFFSPTGKSVKNYYDEVSNGKLQFEPASESSGTSNGIATVSLTYNHPDPVGKQTENALYNKIVSDALKASDAKVDYKTYDTNKDGYISTNELHIVTIVAGGEGSFSDPSPSVWGHRSSLVLNDVPKLDGVKVASLEGKGGYMQFGETQGGHMATIGIMAHELGHDLGLPDLYDRDNSSLGVGVHSLMGEGSWAYLDGEYQGQTPTHLDAWSKEKLGFSIPTLVSSSGTYSVQSNKDGAYKAIRVNTDKADEYFLIENRQYIGYDRGLQNRTVTGGLAIWHIDESQKYRGNDNERNKLVDLEEANQAVRGFSELDNGDWHSKYEHYFTANHYPNFNASSLPNSNLYDGSSSNLSVEALDRSMDGMRIEVSIGTDTTPPSWPSTKSLRASVVEAFSLKLAWSSASDKDGIDHYKIYQDDQVIQTVSDKNSMKITNLAPNTTYRFSVQAVDSAGNESKDGPTVTVKTKLHDILRVKGSDRFGTASAVSEHTYDTATTVLIARGLDFPDALAGSPLAYQLKAPILLAGKSSLPDQTVDEIKRLNASKAIILGGSGAVSESVRDQLKKLGLDVERISGKDRFETAAEIAKRMDPAKKAVVAYGMNFPDALAIAPYAAEHGYPILLANTTKLPAVTKSALRGMNETIVVGGTGVISKAVVDQLQNPTRYSGKNRFGTAADIVNRLYMETNMTYFANGMGFADALTGSVAAAKNHAPLYLVEKNRIPDETKQLINNRHSESYVLLGGTGAISLDVENQLAE